MCLRRRFYKSPEVSVSKGEKRRILYHPGKICIKEFAFYYDGDNDTGTFDCVFELKIDGELLLKETLNDISRFWCVATSSPNASREFFRTGRSDTYKTLSFIIRNLGRVEEGIEVWFENVDTTNGANVRVALVYDVD